MGTFSGGDFPVTNVAPFTYGEGLTYLRQLIQLRQAFNDTVGTLNDNNTILNTFQKAIQDEINAQNTQIDNLGKSLVSYTVTNVGSNVLQLVFQDGSTTQIYNTNGVASQLNPINTDISTLQGDVTTLQNDWSNLDNTVAGLVGSTSALHTAVQNQTVQFVQNTGSVQTAIIELINTLMTATTANDAQTGVMALVRKMATTGSTGDATFESNIKNLIISWLGNFSDALSLALRQQSRLVTTFSASQGFDITSNGAVAVPGMSGSFTVESGVDYKVSLSANLNRNDTTYTPARIGVYVDNQGLSGFPTLVFGVGSSGDGRFSGAGISVLPSLSPGSHTIEVRAYIDSGATGWHIDWATLILEVC